MPKNVSIQLDDETAAFLQAAADQGGTSLRALVTSIVTDAARAEPEPGIEPGAPAGKASTPDKHAGTTWEHWVVTADKDEKSIRLTFKAGPTWDGQTPDPKALRKKWGVPLPTEDAPWIWRDLQSPILREKKVPARSKLQEAIIPVATPDAGDDEVQGEGLSGLLDD